MNGTIEFNNLKELAEFLQAFAGSTAMFRVEITKHGTWELRFTGGF